MAQLALAFAGAAIGGAIGGPTGAKIGWAIGSAAGSAMFADRPPAVHGPRLTDVNVQGASNGEPIIDFRGTSPWVQGHVVWCSPKRETRHKKETGGKGMPSSTQYWYTYDCDLCILIAVGEADTKLRRIRANKSMLLDNSEGSTVVTPNWLKYRFYDGSASQLPDPLVEAALGVGNASAHRGYAYIVLENFQLNANAPNFSGQVPLLEFELARGGTDAVSTTTITIPNSPSSTMGYQVYDPGSGLIFITAENDNGGNPAVYAVEPYSRKVVRSYKLPSGYQWDTAFGVAVSDDGDHLVVTTYNGVVVFARDSGAVVTTLGTVRGGWIRPSKNYYWSNDVKNPIGMRWLPKTLGSAGLTCGYPPSPWLMSGNGDGFGTIVDEDTCYVCVQHSSTNAAGLIRLHLNSLGSAASWGDDDVLLLSSDSVRGEDVLHDPINGCLWVVGSGVAGHGPILNQVDHVNWTLLGSWDWVDDFGQTESSLGSASGSPHMYFDAASAKIYLHFVEKVWIFDTVGKTLQSISCSGGSWSYYHPPTDTLFTGAHYLYVHAHKLHSVTLGTESLPSVVTYWCAQAGVPAGSIDVSGLSGVVRTQVRGRPMPPAALLRDLMVAYQFDVVLSDNKLKFVHRGGASDGTIDRDDLAAHSPGEALPDEMSESRAAETTLPAQVSLSYWSASADWERGTQLGRRLVTDSQHTEPVELSIGLTDAEAAKLADVLTVRAWSERMPATITLPANKYAHWEPTDVPTIPTDDGDKDYTIERMDRGANGVARWELTPLWRDLYTSYAIGGVTGGGGMSVQALGPTQFYPLDIPLLRDQDDGCGYYAAVGWYVDGAPGCVLNSSSDSGTTWDEVDALTEEAVIASATTVLGSSLTTVLDYANSLTVRLMSASMEGRLASTTQAAMLNGANHFVFGASGRWEIVAAQNVVDNGDGTLTLSTFLRGRRGTEWAVGTHAIGDTLIYLNATDTDIARLESSTSQIGVARKYRAVTIGQTLQDASDVSFTLASVGQKPYAPSHLAIEDAGGGDWDVAWNRRTRINGEWRDYVDASLGEASELYRVKVYNGATELSTADVSSEAATVTASSGNTIKVAQVSSVVGAGYYASITVP